MAKFDLRKMSNNRLVLIEINFNENEKNTFG